MSAERGPADDAILIRWDSTAGHWLVSIEDMEPLSAIGVLHLALDAIAEVTDTAVAWDTDTSGPDPG